MSGGSREVLEEVPALVAPPEAVEGLREEELAGRAPGELGEEAGELGDPGGVEEGGPRREEDAAGPEGLVGLEGMERGLHRIAMPGGGPGRGEGRGPHPGGRGLRGEHLP